MSGFFTFEQYRISMLFYVAFLLFFMPMRYRNKTTMWILGAGYVLTGILDYYFLMGYVGDVLMLTLIEIVLVQGQSFLLCKYRDGRALFVGITGSVYVLAGNIAVQVFYHIWENQLLACLGQACVHACLLLIMIWKMRKSFFVCLENREVSWIKICMIPSLFYSCFFFLLVWPSPLEENWDSILTAIMLLALMGSSYILILNFLERKSRENTLAQNNAYLETYAKRLKEEADIMQAQEKEMAILRHDMKHYVLLTQTYLDAKQPEKIHELLSQLNQHLKTLTPERYCDNLSVNGIVTHMCSRAGESQVSFEANMDVPAKLSINEYEFATVVSNLLENAIHAAAEVKKPDKRFVKITSRIVKDQILLEVSNGFRKLPKLENDTHMPISTQSGDGHGYGSQSVQAFVHKNNALFEFARHGRALVGASPEHTQVVGSV